MKKSILLLVSVLMLWNCAEIELTPVETDVNTIQAVMESDDTKTTVTDEGYFAWSAGDRIWLHTTSGSVEGVLSAGAGTAKATFIYGSYIGSLTGKAVYPYGSHEITDSQLTINIPASYELGANPNNTNALMYGVVESGILKFTHLAGVMKFTFNNAPVGTSQFRLTLDRKINGDFQADLTATDPVISAEEAKDDSQRTVTLTFDPLQEVKSLQLYIPLPTGTYKSLALELYTGEESIWSYSNTVTNTINRKTLLLMPTVTIGGSIEGEIENGEKNDGEAEGDSGSDDNSGNNDNSGNEDDYVDEYGINHGPGVEINGVVWAPVNCGYHATDFQWGKLYQWGRKYGQGYSDPEDSSLDDAIIPVFKEAGVPFEQGSEYAYENVFYINKNDWMSLYRYDAWHDSAASFEHKTSSDPCPDGWRVPRISELSGLIRNISSFTTDENGQPGYWCSGSAAYSSEVSQIFLPVGGCRNFYGRVNSRTTRGYYWSSDHVGSGAKYLLLSDAGGEILDSEFPGFGNSVRCVKFQDRFNEDFESDFGWE